MKKGLFLSLLISILIAGCDSGRNIDVADRERRLGGGVGEGDSDGQDVGFPFSAYPYYAQILENRLLTFGFAVDVRNREGGQTLSTNLMIDLNSNEIYGFKNNSRVSYGNVTCMIQFFATCEKFRATLPLDKIFEISSLDNQVAEFFFERKKSVYSLKKFDTTTQSWNTVADMDEFALVTIAGGSFASKYLSFPSVSSAGKPTWLYFKAGSFDLAVPFYMPIADHFFISALGDEKDSVRAIKAKYLRLSDNSLHVEEYRIDDIEN